MGVGEGVMAGAIPIFFTKSHCKVDRGDGSRGYFEICITNFFRKVGEKGAPAVILNYVVQDQNGKFTIRRGFRVDCAKVAIHMLQIMKPLEDIHVGLAVISLDVGLDG